MWIPIGRICFPTGCSPTPGLRIYLDGALAVEIPYIDLLGVLDLPQPERVIDPSKPMIALTFDDGPSKNTAHILDLLKFYNARATFYVVGNRVASYADTAQRAVAEGNELGNHTWEHAKLTALTPEEIAAQLTQTSQAVQQYTGYTITSVRPTGGACNDTVKTVAAQLGLYLVNWSVDTEDWKTRDADATYNAIMSGVSDGAIVLCHDLYESTASAMDRVIRNSSPRAISWSPYPSCSATPRAAPSRAPSTTTAEAPFLSRSSGSPAGVGIKSIPPPRLR